jgi:hypothetical protein
MACDCAVLVQFIILSTGNRSAKQSNPACCNQLYILGLPFIINGLNPIIGLNVFSLKKQLSGVNSVSLTTLIKD